MGSLPEAAEEINTHNLQPTKMIKISNLDINAFTFFYHYIVVVVVVVVVAYFKSLVAYQ